MKKLINIKINGQKIKAREGETILRVTQRNKILIPTLCHHPDLSPKASCQVCLVKIKDEKGLKSACSTLIREGMEVLTSLPEIERARKENLELIFAKHKKECPDCVWQYDCQLLKLVREYKIKGIGAKEEIKKIPIESVGPIEFDFEKCIGCGKCLEVCRKETGFLEGKEKDSFFEIKTSKEKNKECVYCGQCIVHCPVGTIESVGEFEGVEKVLVDKNKFVVAQIAPAVKTTAGEAFGINLGEPVPKKIVAGLKKAGFNKVFDVSLGADITTFEEAKELVARWKEKRVLPMMTSCCPAWVKFVEFYFSEFIPNLTTVRSPHIILGGLIKTYFAEKEKINPKDIIVVSIMPCTSKKYEIQREELKINKLPAVDYVLTTRELVYLLKKKQIDLKNIKEEEFDSPLGFSSGAGAIYGASGGVMESALRTAVYLISGKDLKNLEFKELRGTKVIKEAEIKIGKENLKIAVVQTLLAAKKILKEIKKNPGLYHYIEIMACPGGCVGGGGQILPSHLKIKKERAKGLLKIDLANKIRLAHQNPTLKAIYQNYLTDFSKIKSLCHTQYFKKQKEN